MVWTGGNVEYSEMQEAAPYWFNGVVALAYQLDNVRLKSQALNFLDYMIAHQDATTGWFGPVAFNLTDVVPGTPLLLWPRYMTMLGLVQYAEADSTQTDRIVTLLHNFLPVVQDLANAGSLNASTQYYGFQFSYQWVRWEELVYTLEWLYDNYPRGSFSADEHLAGLGPSRGTELCAIVEEMFSLSTNYQVFGEPSWADLVEQLAYNALPASNTPDFWQHQYLQQTNQIWAKDHLDGFPWQFQDTDDSYSNVFGLESNYPCCTVNHPQGYPKFWANSFVQGASGALVHAYLGPTSFSGTVGSANTVKVAVDTLYPFGSTLSYTISSTKAFSFSIRIPTWAQNLTSSITINGGKAQSVSANLTTALHTINLAKGNNKIELNLDMRIRIESRSNGSALQSGKSPPALGFVVNELEAEFHNVPAQDLTTTTNTTDITYTYTSPWNIAIDPSTLVVYDNSSMVTSLPYYVWDVAAQPIYMTATACEIKWDLYAGDPDWPPASPNNCTGTPFNVTLRPYGGTRLRLAELPTMSL
ncbi:hypothetical protein HWV62_23877 [Athelia sp. TMB]|nr:hypothetical protein HWV62_23877 [Athelia sp. TMB]